MKRLGLAFLAACGVSFGLFFLMASLISGGHKAIEKSDSENFIEFLRVKNDENLQARDRKRPKKPPEPKEAPQRPKLQIAQDQTPQKPQMSMQAPQLADNLALGDGPYLGSAAAGGSSDSDVVPLVRIEPQYPRKAAMQGKQGFVVLSFDITETGAVENVNVLQSQPRRIFDSAAKRALRKWKYKPQVIDGKPTKRKNLKVQLDFKLQG